MKLQDTGVRKLTEKSEKSYESQSDNDSSDDEDTKNLETREKMVSDHKLFEKRQTTNKWTIQSNENFLSDLKLKDIGTAEDMQFNTLISQDGDHNFSYNKEAGFASPSRLQKKMKSSHVIKSVNNKFPSKDYKNMSYSIKNTSSLK